MIISRASAPVLERLGHWQAQSGNVWRVTTPSATLLQAARAFGLEPGSLQTRDALQAHLREGHMSQLSK